MSRFRRVLSLLLGVLMVTGYVAAPATSAPSKRTVDLTVAHGRSVQAKAFRATAAVPGDITGDGKADAVVRDPGADSGSLRLFTHNGETGSNPWTGSVPAGGSWDFADALLLADVTGDARPDVVARDPNTANGTLWVYPYDGSGWSTRFSAGTGWNAYRTIQLGDVTGDGKPDLLGREQAVASGTLWVYPHNGATTANPWPAASRYWAGTGWNLANVMVLADVNGDAGADMVVRDGSGALWIYPHNGNLRQNPYTSRYGAGTGWNLADVMLLADATGDGDPDIVARDGTGALWVYPHSGVTTGNPWTAARYAAGTGWSFANAFLAGDVSGDGKPDLLTRVHGGDLWVYPNDGSTPWVSRFAAGSRWAFENQLLLGDVNLDGKPDLVTRDPAVSDGALWVYPGDGATDRDPWTGPRVLAGTGWNLATAMVLGDLTGDGRPDVLARDRAGDLWIYPHNGGTDANPWTGSRVWAGTGWNTAARIALADVDGDGRQDLVDLEQDGTLWVYVTGGGPTRIAGDWSGVAVLATGDVDGDGRPDLVTRDTAGALWVHPHSGAAQNPWLSAQAAGTGWSFASAILL